MKVTLTYINPADIQCECLVVFALDHNADKSKDAKPQPRLATDGFSAGSDVLATGDVTAKNFETTLLHAANGTKSKRLLIVGAGKAAKFGTDELRKAAGAAVRYLKSKNIRSLAVALPSSLPADAALRATVEGAFVADFDPNYYHSDRKDLALSELVIVAPAGSDKTKLDDTVRVTVVISESQNFTRDLVNEPSNRMTPTILSDRAKAMAKEFG